MKKRKYNKRLTKKQNEYLMKNWSRTKEYSLADILSYSFVNRIIIKPKPRCGNCVHCGNVLQLCNLVICKLGEPTFEGDFLLSDYHCNFYQWDGSTEEER